VGAPFRATFLVVLTTLTTPFYAKHNPPHGRGVYYQSCAKRGLL